MERNLKARKLIISGCFFAGVSFSSKSLHIKTERSEEHTSELQSPDQLVCRLLLEKKINLVTNETVILVMLNIDGSGKSLVKTGVPFFDHMLPLFAKHAVVYLDLRCAGDLGVDVHH